MRTSRSVHAVVWTAAAGIVAAANIVSAQVSGVPAQRDAVSLASIIAQATDYVLRADSTFAQGCMGSAAGGHGCMCPLEAASAFTGGFAVSLDHHAPPGHHRYRVAVEDWLFVLDGAAYEVTGAGSYDRWTDMQGHRRHSMSIDLVIYGEDVHLWSGVLDDPESGDEPPGEICLALESDTECFGFFIVLEAERLGASPTVPNGQPLFGGPCEYADTPGTSTIVAVEAPDPSLLNCSNNPVEVVFDFLPDDPANEHLAATGERLTIGEGVNPPRAWVEGEGLMVGSQHPCVRRDMVSGTCTPLLFEFPDVNVQTGLDVCYAATTFAMTVVPVDVPDAIYEQQIVLLVAIRNYGSQPVSEPAHVTVAAPGADITIKPENIMPWHVCEIAVVPHEPAAIEPRARSSPEGGGRPAHPPGEPVVVQVRAERNGFEEVREVSINILPGEDALLADAAAVRDRFIPYLHENYPWLGITEETVWNGTIVKPHYWVVSHYLFFSEKWEMGVKWHNTVPPHDWAEIYLRHRYTHIPPQYALRISSLGTEPPLQPFPVDPPEQVDR